MGNYRQSVRASVGPFVSADAVTGFKEGFPARGRGTINFYDGERLLGQCVLMHVLD